jgi:hypothetical protein
VTCPSLPDPDNGTVDIGNATVGTTAVYSCNFGFELSSTTSAVTCQADGAWHGTPPSCLAWGGMTCTSTPDCPSYATCCNGSDKRCDGIRVPSGDGTNLNEFEVRTDGKNVRDTITGLVWQCDGSGARSGCDGDADGNPGGNVTCTWEQAKAYCSGLSLGGFSSGWWLPGMHELVTIVDFTQSAPAIDQNAFGSTPSAEFWWTSTPAAYASRPWAWVMSFTTTWTHSEDAEIRHRVRCVH